MFIVNRNKFQLGFDNIVLEITNMCQDNVRHGKKTVQMSDFNSFAVLLLWVKLCYGILLRNVWRAGLQSCSWKGWSMVFGVLTLRYLVQQGEYCIVPTYLAAQQQNKLTQFPVCVNVGVLFSLEILPQAGEKHTLTWFSLQQFQFWSITEPEMLCHVLVHRLLSD